MLTRTWRERWLPKVEVMLGDFNIVEEALDRLPPHLKQTRPVEALQEFKSLFLLNDGWRRTYPGKLAYTHTQGTIHSCLDRIYVSTRLWRYSTEWEIDPPPFQTDHDIVSVRVLNPEEPKIGIGRWAIPQMVTDNEEFISKARELGVALEKDLNANPHMNKQTRYATFKNSIIMLAKNYASKSASILDKRINAKKAELEAKQNNPHIEIDQRRVDNAVLRAEIMELERTHHKRTRKKVALRHKLDL